MRNILLCYFYTSLRQQEMKKSLLQCTKSKNMPQAIQLDKKFLSLADKEIVNHDFLCARTKCHKTVEWKNYVVNL